MCESHLKITHRDFSKIVPDDSTMENPILKVPGSIYKEKHGFASLRMGQNLGGYPPHIYIPLLGGTIVG